MKHLTLSESGRRLTLVVPDQTTFRAAAKAIRGYRFEGRNDGHAVFSFPAAPDVARDVCEFFDPVLSPSHKDPIDQLRLRAIQLDAAVAAKDFDGSMIGEPGLATDPMAHQVGAYNFCMARLGAGAHGAGLLMEQGTGKTLVAIALANALYKQGAIRWALVVAPNTLKGTWAEEIEKHTQPALSPWVLIPKGTRAQRLAAVEDMGTEEGGLNWVVTNVEGWALNPRKQRAHKDLLDGWLQVLQSQPGLLIIDESTTVKNPKARRTLVLEEVSKKAAASLILTGTPVTSSPLDVFGQFEVMEQGSLGFQSYVAFDRAYALRQHRRSRTGGYYEVVGYQNLEDLEARVAKLSYRARAKDCLDLPPVSTKSIPVELTAEQARILKEVKKGVAELGDGFVDGRNILTRYLRMAQTIGGYVGMLGPDGKKIEGAKALDPNPKLAACLDYHDLLFEDPTQKGVVFCQFTPEIEALRDAARERGWKPALMYGGESEEARESGRKRFKDDPATRIFIAQYQAGSMGLTLTSAASIMFYSLTFSLKDFQQARKRVDRIGQEHPVTEVYLLGQTAGRRGPKQTLDHEILRSLEAKQDFADRITGDHRSILKAL